MAHIYEIMETMLPFEFIQYDFMKNALLAILIMTPLFGMLGTVIVNNRLAFFSEALGHSALTGIALGIVLGIANTNVSMICFAFIFALLLNYIKRKKTVSTDTIISVFSSLSSAIGLVILSKGGNFAKYSNILVGDVLSIKRKELLALLLIFVVTVIFWVVFYNKLHAISINETLARSKQINVVLIDNLFVLLIACIVMLSIKWVGTLIINALLILPAASSRNIAVNNREYHWFAVIISMFSGIVGLIVSYYIGTATGPTIVIIASVIFFLTFSMKHFMK